jgi:UDP-glucose 4-epimerase
MHTDCQYWHTNNDICRQDCISEELGLDSSYEYTGGKRRWQGDVLTMDLSTEKHTGFGWVPSLSSEQAMRRATRDLPEETTMLHPGRY